MTKNKVGQLLFHLRRECGMTQRELADQLMVSDKTVSKWERGLGLPDISILPMLAECLGVNIETILSGELVRGDEGGMMRKRKIYVCSKCQNIVQSGKAVNLSCCNQNLEPLEIQEADGHHQYRVEVIEDDYFITFDHEMIKEHYLSFGMYVLFDNVHQMKLYPEQSATIRFPKTRGGKLVVYCSQHGLYEVKL